MSEGSRTTGCVCVCRVYGNWSELPFEMTEREHTFGVKASVAVLWLFVCISPLCWWYEMRQCATMQTHTHVDTLVSLVWLSAGSYLQTWEWTCPCWQHTLPVTCSPGPSQSPAEQLRDSPPGGKSGSWAPPLPISINLMPSHHTVAKMRCAKHCQIKDCTPPVRIIPKQARSFPKMSSLPAKGRRFNYPRRKKKTW